MWSGRRPARPSSATAPFSAGCQSSTADSIHCQSLVHRHCKTLGFVGAIGVTGVGAGFVATVCLSSSVASEVAFESVADLKSGDPSDASCSAESVARTMSCMHSAHRFCRKKGFGAGFTVAEFDGSKGSLVCAHARQSSVFEPYGSGLKRHLSLGTMVVGGPSTAGDLCHPDAVTNNLGFDVQWESAEVFTTYPGPSFSSDACFSLNRQAIWQFNNSFDGELACVYTDQKAYPSMAYSRLNAAPVIHPGETVIFQATPKWKSGGHGLCVTLVLF